MARIVSFCLPHLVVVSVFRMFIDLSALALVSLVCSLKFSFVSSVSPSIFGFRMVGIKVLFMVRLSVVLYSAGSGVKSVEVDLSGLS